MLAIILILGVSAFADEMPAITSSEMTFYLCNPNDTRTMSVYFMDESDVPYMSLEDWGGLYTYVLRNYAHKGQDISFELHFSMEGDVGTLSREDGYPMIVDCASNTITFWDYDAFIRPEDERVLIDILPVDNPHTDEEQNLFRRTNLSYERYGDPVVLDLSAYGIDLISDGKACYVPLQTLSDFLLAIKYLNAFYNGECVIISNFADGGLEDSNTGKLNELVNLYYSVEPKKLSESTTAFNYAELCLALDKLYGMKETHGIKSFENLSMQTGYNPDLKSTDPSAVDEALYKTIELHLDDGHSHILLASPFSSDGLMNTLHQTYDYGFSFNSSYVQKEKYEDARSKAYPDGIPCYEEIGNTAYITFDEFTSIPEGVDFYKTAPTAENTDTIGIMIYAYSQITRENSPIENVVLDLSVNGGGDVDTGIFVISSFLGMGSMSVRNTLSGGLATGIYNVDLNLDGLFDKNDYGLRNRNLFCITSPSSYSCGNLVPCVLKSSNNVTMLGRTSGGGAYCVFPLSTAHGAFIQLSEPMCLSYTHNGSFFNAESGAEPDFVLATPEKFYNRQDLTDYINSISKN